MRSRRRNGAIKRCFLAITTLLLLCSVLDVSNAAASNAASKITTTTTTTTTTKPTTSNDEEKVITIVETEVWDGTSWKAPREEGRWSMDEKPSDPPPKLKAPPRYKWSDTWKIVTTNRDELGWLYEWHPSHPYRRRTWLRTATKTQIKSSAPPVTTTTTTTTTTPKSFLSRDWNFKGFGCAFYKSLIFPNAFGVAFRSPLSTNLDWFDRHTGIPSITTSVGFYYPYMAVVFINASINVQYLQWAFSVVMERIQQFLNLLGLLVCLTLSWPLALAMPTQYHHVMWKSWAKPLIQSLKHVPPFPQTSLELQERVGMSVSWRISQRRGYEYRVSYWYMCLPTLLYCGRLVSKPFQRLLLRGGNNKEEPRWIHWLRQHTGSLGLATGAPIPDFPHVSASLFLSLSGFYLKNLKQSVLEVLDKDEEKSLSVPPVVSKRVTSGNNSTMSDTEQQDEIPAPPPSVASSGSSVKVAS